jgi:hypothetical protein
METTGPGSKLSYTPSTLEGAMALADILAKSKVGIPDTLQGKPAEILTVVMQGAELGLTPLRSLNQIHVIKGRTTLAAQLMSAMVKSHPLCKYLRLKQEIKDGAGHVVGVEYETHREGDPGPVVMSFTLQDASQMGLLNKDNWKKQPVTMMRARGISRICREVYPDLIGGMYAKEEIQDNVLDTEPPVVVDAEVVAGAARSRPLSLKLSRKLSPSKNPPLPNPSTRSARPWRSSRFQRMRSRPSAPPQRSAGCLWT